MFDDQHQSMSFLYSWTQLMDFQDSLLHPYIKWKQSFSILDRDTGDKY